MNPPNVTTHSVNPSVKCKALLFVNRKMDALILISVPLRSHFWWISAPPLQYLLQIPPSLHPSSIVP